MNLLQALSHYLLSQSGVTTLVGQRVFYDRRPQGSGYPAIYLTEIAAIHDHHQTAADGVIEAYVQVDCYDNTRASDAVAVREAVETVLDGKLAATIGPTGSTVSLIACDVEQTSGTIELPEDGSDGRIYRQTMDLRLWHRKTVPTFS